jgi:uncharacterized protein with GYD domain
MAKYISLVKYTAKGIENVKESPNRLDAVYDIIMITDAPNPETVAKIILTITSGGAVSTETLHAFPEEEYRKIISELP